MKKTGMFQVFVVSSMTLATLLFGNRLLAAAPPRPPAEVDIAVLLTNRDPSVMFFGLEGDSRERVEQQFNATVTEASAEAASIKVTDLYPNPMIQAYVNRLGQTLIPPEASERIFVTFRVLEDPAPFAAALPTGTIYLSSGLISLLDNESQLAFILMHEAGHIVLSHHLQQAVQEEKTRKETKAARVIGTAAGILVGKIAGQEKGELLVDGILGLVGGNLYGKLRGNFLRKRLLRESQIESDHFATEVLLNHGFDARESIAALAKIGRIVRRSGTATELAFGGTQDLPERSARLNTLFGGRYKALVSGVLAGEGFRMSSPRFSQLMSELKRDNGLLALERDLFAIAQSNLEEAASVRTDDPLTMYGLGMLYRTVGRTPEELAKASSFLKSAMEFDEVRHRFPEAHLQYAVELLSRENPQLFPEIQSSLKTYVALYQRKTGGSLPREMNFIYDYMDLTGDRSWIAFAVQNISAQPPYQLTDGETRQSSPANSTASKK